MGQRRVSSVIFLSTFALMGLGACSKQSPQEALPEPTTTKGDRPVTPLERSKGLVKNWFTKDPELDGVEGMSVDRAYSELNLRVGVAPVTVAVIDSGIDRHHPDLQGRIYTNAGEIPGNGIDDDGNGYVDDVNGWNFLGSVDKDGKPRNIDATTLEVTRESVRMKKLKALREAQGIDLTPEELAYHNKVTQAVGEALIDAQKRLSTFTVMQGDLEILYAPLANDLGTTLADVTPKILQDFRSDNADLIKARDAMLAYLAKNKITLVGRVQRQINRAQDEINYQFNEKYDPRADIIGDDITDYEQRYYGNNDSFGPSADHGTHVAGIIGAVRGNSVGIDGVAHDVRIIPLRAVPNGDEYDKDVANAVRYAVDQGARVINMSFGKQYSPGKSAVDAAFQYAEQKGALIFHSAGNDGTDIDVTQFYPNPRYLDQTRGQSWITVGASAAIKGKELPAVFSNYGQVEVDLFAPGVEVESTIPDNKYAAFSGTSMAGPAAAGVAALILGQYPQLSALQVRQAMMSTVRKYPGLLIRTPTEAAAKPESLFETLSVSGGIVNAVEALKSAAELVR